LDIGGKNNTLEETDFLTKKDESYTDSKIEFRLPEMVTNYSVKANSLYKSGQYADSIDYYSKSIDSLLKCLYDAGEYSES
jgi:hypothetical protein